MRTIRKQWQLQRLAFSDKTNESPRVDLSTQCKAQPSEAVCRSDMVPEVLEFVKGRSKRAKDRGLGIWRETRDVFAQKFIRSPAIASIDRGLTNKWMVLDEVAFAKKDAPEIADRKNKIELLGKEYLRKTHAYGFRQPYVRLED